MNIYIVTFTSLLLIFLAILIEEKTHKLSINEIVRRHYEGDMSCGMCKTWYGWRVKEYAE